MNNNLEIAIIGMSCRFPGAKDIDKFWHNLQEGVESISFFDDQELLSAGVDPALLNKPNYVKANAVLSDIELFDASFFDFSAREAEIMDPQHRLFLEHAWEAIENAGYNTQTYEGSIGVYAGADADSYLLNNICPNIGFSDFQTLIANDKDYLPTRVSYKLNLKGPSIAIQTACSTSLVSVHIACQSLLNGECDMALAGGISIKVPQAAGYLYQEEMVTSPDGHCRTFDNRAQGTVFGNGLGIVVLKRLSDAIADGDYIHAVIKGSAVNNDGSLKLSYTAPSIEGQTQIISETQTIAEIDPETITYIEAHGTATNLGDPIEVEALTQAFRARTQRKGFCAIGSVKTNFGHLGAAAGVAGLIKTVLALKHQLIPPSLHFEQPNPKIDFANSPFYVNTKLTEWQNGKTPRRAGVSSFGIGGTNAHVILEEAPPIETSVKSHPWQLLILSAKTSSALSKATANLAEHLKQHPDINLANVAYTLQVGRKTFSHRRMVVCENLDDVVKALENLESQEGFSHDPKPCHRPVVFMFSGQGAQYVNMAEELYQLEPTFREQVDICSDILYFHMGLDLRHVLFPSEEQSEEASQQLQQTAITQPALFVIEYALAKVWIKCGVHPTAMIGHSVGEYVAATIAGVFSLEDALVLIATRGQLMQALPSGTMLAVPLSEEEVQPLLGKTLSLAAINGSSSCVVSGPTDAVEALQNHLASQGVDYRRLITSHAFHSQMMEPMLELFAQQVKQVSLKPPQIPYLSNVTGTWITAEEATSPNYWVSHVRQTVRFAQGLQELLKEPAQILLEVGPGRTLSKLAKQHPDRKPDRRILTSVRHPKELGSDVAFFLKTLGQLWLFGVQVDWSGFYSHERRHRLPLPTYPFEHQRYWIESQKQAIEGGQFQLLPTALELWKSLVKAGQLQASTGISELDEPTHLEQRSCMARLCTAYMNLALKRLGAFSNPSGKYSLEELFEQHRIIPRYQQLLCRWLQVLVEQGQLQQEEELFTNLLPLPTDSLNAFLEEVRGKFAQTPQVADMVQLCGENLAAVLVGEKEPLEFFNALVYDKEAENSNLELPGFTYYNAIMRSSLEQLVKSLPPSVNLRILEIGAGMGITTTELLPVLPPKQTNYTFTDVGSAFLTQAQRKFSNYPFIDYRVLDIEKPPQEQGFERHSFDVVVASNVLHVTKNMEETLNHVRSLLAPGGFLLLWETTQPQLDFDITWGLLMNPLEDEERSKGNPFLSREQWQEALTSNGLVEVAAFPETDDFGQHILMARASASTVLPTPAAFTANLEKQDVDRTSQVSLGKKSDIAEWFYTPSWKRFMPPQPFQSGVQATEPGCWLVFVDECGLGSQILKQLELEDRDVVSVSVGEQFSRKSTSPNSSREYIINPQHKDDYNALLEELLALELRPTKIVHLWSVTSQNHIASRLEAVDQAQDKGFYSLLFLAQALGKQNLTDELQIQVISNNLQSVTGEEMLSLEKATLLGAVRVIPLEYPNIGCRSIDVMLPEAGSWQEEKIVECLLAELSVNTSEQVIAYRGVHRWVQSFEPVRLDEAFEGTPRLRQEGVYLITGGLGAIGLALASHLAKTVRAKLILTGRSAFPAKDEWEEWLSDHDSDDEVSGKIRKLQELEKLGAEVLVARADVADLESMQQAIARAQECFGQINGVIHAAGVLGDSMIGRKTREEVESVLAPKVRGTLVLDTILKDVELDFMVLCSSGASIKPLFGQISYCSANNFLDAFAHYKNSTNGSFTVSINWVGWQEAGMGVEGVKRLEQVLTVPEPQVKEVAHPLFDHCLVEGQDREIYVSKFKVNELWVFNEHRLAGKATLPGTAYLEMVKAAWENYTQQQTLEIQEIYFFKPLTVEENEKKEVRTILQKQGEVVEFVIMSQSESDPESWLEHAKGKVSRLESEPPEKLVIDELKAKCNQQELIIAEQEPTTAFESLEYGARWNNVEWIQLGENQGLALLKVSEEYASDFNSYQLHPALLDLANGFLSLKFLDESLYLPFSYKSLKIKESLPKKIYSYIRVVENSERSGEILKFNITILNEQGTKLVEIEEYALRRVNQSKTDPSAIQQSTIPSENFYLDISRLGRLDTLRFQPAARQQPGHGEVEIEVEATGLNFKEVLIALGLISVPSELVFRFGIECAGKVSALGEGVEGFEIGDEVIAFSSSCFSRFTTTPAKLVAPKPKHLSLEEAATIPIAFHTAYTALIYFGRLKKGEKVLIHSAAGGVGMAAVQITQWVGAEIFATAGNPQKREFLQSLGIKHVMDSRSVAFAEQVMQLTDGTGVDVVLNSLGGEFIPKSLSILAPYGRFLELGVRDIFNNTPLNLGVFKKCLSFFAIQAEPKRPEFTSLWQEVVQHFQQKNFQPMPYKVFPITEITTAFEYMSQSKHIGKIVVSQQDKEVLKNLLVVQEEASKNTAESGAFAVPLSSVSSVSSTIGSDSLQKTAASASRLPRDIHQNWLSPSEGIEVFERILASRFSQVLVSTIDFLTLSQQNNIYEVLSSPNNSENFSQPIQSTHSRPELDDEYIAPSNEIEKMLSDIWQENLGINQVGIHDNFFELGGDSLIAVKVVSCVRETFQVEISTSLIFEQPTIAGIAEYIEKISKIAEKLNAPANTNLDNRKEIEL